MHRTNTTKKTNKTKPTENVKNLAVFYKDTDFNTIQQTTYLTNDH